MTDKNTNLEKKILIVDDEEMLRNFYSSIISPLGYAVETAENGEEALEKIYSNKFVPDLIFSDILMPKMNGLELATRIKNDEKYKNIKFIINSSTVNEEYIQTFGEIGIIKENIYNKLNNPNLFREIIKNALYNPEK